MNAGVVEFDNWITRTDVLLAIKDLGDVKMHAFWKLSIFIVEFGLYSRSNIVHSDT